MQARDNVLPNLDLLCGLQHIEDEHSRALVVPLALMAALQLVDKLNKEPTAHFASREVVHPAAEGSESAVVGLPERVVHNYAVKMGPIIVVDVVPEDGIKQQVGLRAGIVREVCTGIRLNFGRRTAAGAGGSSSCRLA